MKRFRTVLIAATLAAAGSVAGAGAANAQGCDLEIETFNGERCMSIVPNDQVETTGSGYGSFGTESLAALSNQILHLGSMVVSVELPMLTDSLGLTSPQSTAHSLGEPGAESVGGSVGSADDALE